MVVDVSGCTVLLLCGALGEVEDCREKTYYGKHNTTAFIEHITYVGESI
jgi:hypothetical protein